jgi:eukaryotic-like serine/threonine-protein kinase
LLTRLDAAIEETHGRGWLAAAGLGTIGSTAATIAAGTTLTGTASAATATGATTTTAAAATKTGTSTLSRGKLIGAAATVAAIIAVVIAFILSRPEPPRPTATQTTPTPPAAAAAPLAQPTVAGTYLVHYLSAVCNGYDALRTMPDMSFSVTQQGNTVTVPPWGATGPLNADGSFAFDWSGSYSATLRGVFATEGGRMVIHGEGISNMGGGGCHDTYVATKQ